MEKILGERAQRIRQMKEMGLLMNQIAHPQEKRKKCTEKIQTSSLDQKPPDGWLDCPYQSQPIGCFIASKTPLSSVYDSHVSEKDRYTPSTCLELAKNVGISITLVVDLTNTCRYYNSSAFENEGICYVKIQCEGRNSPPDSLAISKFIYYVQSHQAKAEFKDNRCGILVHCTHGFNRSGSMIVHYLQRTEQWPDLNKHILTFSKCRPPGIYKTNYLRKLFESYLEFKQDLLVFPKLPYWKHSSSSAPPVSFHETEDLFQQRYSRINSNHPPEQKRIPVPLRYTGKRFSNTNSSQAEIDDLLGEEVCGEQASEVQKLVTWACFHIDNYRESRNSRPVFPGSQPVSLNSINLSMICDRRYSVTWKADGVRYLILILRDGTYLIDRKFAVRRVQMRFPLLHHEGNKVHHITLLDGEMVLDFDPVSKIFIRRYLAYDCMAVNGELLGNKPFFQRLQLLNSEVIEPRKYFFSKLHSNYDLDRELFSVRLKNFYPLSSTKFLLENFIPNLCHESDGLIFQPQDSKYIPNTFDALLKWKFPKMNSVDFYLKFDHDLKNNLEPFLFVGGRDGKLIRINDKFISNAAELLKLDGKIVECSWDFNQKSWIYMRTRLDKTTPNFINVYENTLKSIKDNITGEDILKFIDSSKKLEK
jgi:mRNA-capping enzyme